MTSEKYIKNKRYASFLLYKGKIDMAKLYFIKSLKNYPIQKTAYPNLLKIALMANKDMAKIKKYGCMNQALGFDDLSFRD